MTNACRTNLRDLTSITPGQQFSNVGLGLDRYLKQHAGDEQKKGNTRPEVALLEAACSSSAPEVYKSAYARWKGYCQSSRSLLVEATLCSSLAVGVGRSSPLEVGIHLHHTYGMPIIPGSAVKGVCRFAAKRQDFDIAGCTGALGFWDGWYDPESASGKPFHRDVITVHHPRYYGSQGSDWPTDFDDPVPVNFLVVKPGARFLFAVSCASERWETFVSEALEYSLTHVGLGAKTNAGYGRFTDIKICRPPPEPKEGVWRGVQITRKPSPLEFTFSVPEGESYRLQSAKAEEINRAFTREFRERLKKKNTFTGDVFVTVIGDNVEITGIVPGEDAAGGIGGV
jgi:CRISPR-associated protein Cmr6